MKISHGLILISLLLSCGCSNKPESVVKTVEVPGASELVGKWVCVGDSYSYKAKSIEFFDDGVAFMLTDKSTGEYGEAATYRLLPDGRVRLLVAWSMGFAKFKDGKLSMNGVTYKKDVPAVKVKG